MERYTTNARHSLHIISAIVAFIAFVLMIGTAGMNDTGTAFALCRSNFLLLLGIFVASAYISTRTN